MAILASDILGRVRTQLIDPTGVRWTDAELCLWLADGCRSITAAVPSATATLATLPLAAGTLQTIPADGHMLLDITRNVDSSGLIPGRAVRIIPRDSLDSFDPYWHQSQPSPYVSNYVFDPQVPDTFYVYPPNNGQGYLEIKYALATSDFTTTSTVIPFWDIYQTPLYDYVMFRAMQKDSDFAAGQQLAAVYFNAFTSFISSDDKSQLESNPNLAFAPFSPETQGTAKA